MGRYFISASRRTDIPAFFSAWFLEALRKEQITLIHPFNQRQITVNLSPEKILGVIFWSKDYAPLLPLLPEINARLQQRLYFHYTINGYQLTTLKYIEPDLPSPVETFKTLEQLATLSSPPQIAWRFDPIIFLNDELNVKTTVTRFTFLLKRIHPWIGRIYISFIDVYKKVERRFQKITPGLLNLRPEEKEQLILARELKALASEYNLQLFSCCEPQLQLAEIPPGHCIDSPYLVNLFKLPDHLSIPIKPTRKNCGCFYSIDIGTYNTCKHGCLYCYAS